MLNLYGKELAARLGLQGGQIFLVSSPEEDPQLWRTRCQKAWIHDVDASQDHVRREAIARAERLETIFRMLEASNMHFRFEPGPLPPLRTDRRPGPRRRAAAPKACRSARPRAPRRSRPGVRG
ncbi:MAG: hypothetical protein R3F34_00415 [Planctomycetota bacterium]